MAPTQADRVHSRRERAAPALVAMPCGEGAVSGGHGYFPFFRLITVIYFTSARSGPLTPWRAPSAVGPPSRCPREGGSAPRLPADGLTLFYRRASRSFPACRARDARWGERFRPVCSYYGYAARSLRLEPDPANRWPRATRDRRGHWRTRTFSRSKAYGARMSVSADGTTLLGRPQSAAISAAETFGSILAVPQPRANRSCSAGDIRRNARRRVSENSGVRR